MPGLNVAKVTLSFAQGPYGWTENYFLNTPSSDFSVEIPKARTLSQKRAALSGKETTIPYFKISNESILRDVYVEGQFTAGNTSKSSDDPTTALLVKKINATNTINVPVYVRGVWDEVIITGGLFDYSNADYQAVYNAWKAYLVSAAFGFIARDPTLRKNDAIDDITSDPNGQVNFFTAGNVFAGITVGTKLKVFISGVVGAAAINGSHVVTVTAANTAKTLKPVPILPYQSGGNLSFNTDKFWPIALVSNERVVERKVGRPLYLSRGRRANRRLY